MAAHPSGLNKHQRGVAKKLVMQAAWLAYRHRGAVHYTQGGMRWQGIRSHLIARNGHYPNWADCSSYTTWCLWNGLRHYGVRDVVNGLNWNAGYTGTQLNHGVRATGRLLQGDLVIYGRSFPGHHVAIYVGNGMVLSHGQEAGPLYLPYRYRSDILSIRRYI
jgi:cell wall-associated NlpC family hydrolase